MKIWILLFSLMSISASVCAETVFTEKRINQLQLKEVDMSEGSAVITDDEANESIIYLEDSVGSEQWEVVGIAPGAITLRGATQETRIRTNCGFGGTD